MNGPKYKVGDRIRIDLTGCYIALCEECGEVPVFPAMCVDEDLCSQCCESGVMRLRDLDPLVDITYPEEG